MPGLKEGKRACGRGMADINGGERGKEEQDDEYDDIDYNNGDEKRRHLLNFKALPLLPHIHAHIQTYI